jgi:hypothetical protein
MLRLLAAVVWWYRRQIYPTVAALPPPPRPKRCQVYCRLNPARVELRPVSEIRNEPLFVETHLDQRICADLVGNGDVEHGVVRFGEVQHRRRNPVRLEPELRRITNKDVVRQKDRPMLGMDETDLDERGGLEGAVSVTRHAARLTSGRCRMAASWRRGPSPRAPLPSFGSGSTFGKMLPWRPTGQSQTVKSNSARLRAKSSRCWRWPMRPADC